MFARILSALFPPRLPRIANWEGRIAAEFVPSRSHTSYTDWGWCGQAKLKQVHESK